MKTTTTPNESNLKYFQFWDSFNFNLYFSILNTKLNHSFEQLKVEKNFNSNCTNQNNIDICKKAAK